MKKYFVMLLLMLTVSVSAQQDPIYAQYLNNPLVINPANAGLNNQFNARLQYRYQWAGIEANPQTFNFSGNASVVQNRVGLGLVVVHDQLGDIKNTELIIPASYKIKFKDTYFSFGMQAGFLNLKNDPSALTIRHPDDPAFASFSETKFNLGAGAILKGQNFRIGLSVPRLLPARVSTGGASIELYKQHYYVLGSYIMRPSLKWWFRPSVLLRATKGVPLSADVNATVTYREFYSIGIFTRNFKSYGALLQILFGNYYMAYTFELPGNQQNGLRFTSHEITIGISLGLLTYHDKAPSVY